MPGGGLAPPPTCMSNSDVHAPVDSRATWLGAPRRDRASAVRLSCAPCGTGSHRVALESSSRTSSTSTPHDRVSIASGQDRRLGPRVAPSAGSVRDMRSWPRVWPERLRVGQFERSLPSAAGASLPNDAHASFRQTTGAAPAARRVRRSSTTSVDPSVRWRNARLRCRSRRLESTRSGCRPNPKQDRGQRRSSGR